MDWIKTRYPGVYVQHRKGCPAPDSRCRCDPSYRVRYRPRDTDGNPLPPKWSPVQRDLAAARTWQADANTKAKATADPDAPKSSGTFETLAIRWLEGARSGAITHKGRKYSERTVTMYERHLKRWIMPSDGDPDWPTYGDRDAASLTALDWQMFVDALARKGLAHNTLQSVFNAPRAIYRWACAPARRLLPANATTGVEFPARDEKARDRIAPPEEAVELLAALDEADRLDFGLALYAGLRGKERRGLEWDRHVVFKGAKPLRLKITRDITKSAAGVRSLPVIALLSPILLREWLRQGKPKTGVVVPRDPTWEAHYEAQRRRVPQVWEAAGLTPIGLHEARHTFASYLIAAQAKAGRPNAKVIQTLMGHASIQETFDRYGKLFPGHEDEASEILDAYLGTGEGDG